MTEAIARRYRRFAEHEAHGHSPLYECFAAGVAEDASILAFLADLPEAKQQPNLLLAALRFVAGTPAGWPDFAARFHAHRGDIATEMMRRRTQTNEPARCAVLLPVLSRLPGPLALIEVGASAGLCLLPDRYGYSYGDVAFGPEPRFVCRATIAPDGPPAVAWRAGLDLNPLDVRNADEMAWLEALVWPDQPHRLSRLRAAVAVAQADPPPVEKGDLLTDLPALAANVPRDATLVVFHTAVLAYVTDPQARAGFARTVRELGAVWISNEIPVLSSVKGPKGAFLLSVNGEPAAWTDPHGAWIDWFGGPCILDRLNAGGTA